ncbi:hypothetical protein SETIT_9G364500v2 [Setaria italica]|uniref:Mitochondrial import inner membrane translocase subunit TIM17 n=1 Tax=Setaria italica TaxID=4555 RepID=K4AJD9_SETIT|nr:hypothetical protein SETIT_9G364500v2 [Setaria italica]
MGWLDEPSYAHLPGARRHIIDEVGCGFWCGMTGGSAYHFLKGLRNSPNGDRLAGGARAVRAHAPRLGGSWAGFWAVWEVFENAIFFARRKEDPWNGIAAGAATWGLVDLRRGARVAARSTLVGAAVIGLAEGLRIWLDKHVVLHPAPTVEPPPSFGHVAAWPALTVDRRPRPLGSTPEGHVPKIGGFLGIPPRAPIVKEVPAADVGY